MEAGFLFSSADVAVAAYLKFSVSEVIQDSDSTISVFEFISL